MAAKKKTKKPAAKKKVAKKATKVGAKKTASAKKKVAKKPTKVAKKPTKVAAKKPGAKKPGAKKSAAAKKKPTTKAASALKAGVPAPDFALRDQTGRSIKLSDYRGRKLLIYFYPKADTPGCTVQSCTVRDARKELTTIGVEVLGISPDQPTTQSKFDQKYGLGFPLLSDPDHATASAYGAWGQKSMYGQSYMGIIRSSFLVGEDGRLLGAWSPVKPDETVPNARASVAAAAGR